MYIAVGVILAVIALCILLIKLYFIRIGNEKLIINLAERTPFAVIAEEKTRVTIITKLSVTNTGKQIGVIMDAFLRPLLPYEQYDGIKVCGKVEREGAPREDDYFEATIIEPKASIFINAYVTLTARKGMDIKTAVAHMVDFSAELIYQEVGRCPWRYSKATILIQAEEVARLLGVTLIDD